MSDDALTEARKAQIEAETRVLELESLVELLERQRDYADRLLLKLHGVAGIVAGPVTRTTSYANAGNYLRGLEGVDKYERRLMEPGEV